MSIEYVKRMTYEMLISTLKHFYFDHETDLFSLMECVHNTDVCAPKELVQTS